MSGPRPGKRVQVRLRTSAPGVMTKLGLVVGPILLVIAIRALYAFIVDQDESAGAGAGVLGFWGVVILVASIRSKRHGATYLRVDVQDGMATFVDRHLDRATARLHELGPLSVTTTGGVHELRAAGLPGAVLYTSPTLLPLQRRRIELERLIDQHAIRQVLLNDAPDDGAFRDDPDLAFRARAAVPDRVRLTEVLDVLARDATLRPRVEALRAALASPTR